MFYIDTSVLVAALVFEPHSDRVIDWLGEQNPRSLHISDWSITELSSALALKLRTGQIEPQQRTAAVANFAKLRAESFKVLPVSSEHFHTAAHFSDRHDLAVKAADALHLAIAADNRMTLCTLDKRLSKGAMALGKMTRLL